MSQEIQLNEIIGSGLRRGLAFTLLALAVTAAAVPVASAAQAPLRLAFANAAHDLPIVMPICCQGRRG